MRSVERRRRDQLVVEVIETLRSGLLRQISTSVSVTPPYLRIATSQTLLPAYTWPVYQCEVCLELKPALSLSWLAY